jgi:hypothetical protein
LPISAGGFAELSKASPILEIGQWETASGKQQLHRLSGATSAIVW